jgi:hypothetical protein
MARKIIEITKNPDFSHSEHKFVGIMGNKHVYNLNRLIYNLQDGTLTQIKF